MSFINFLNIDPEKGRYIDNIMWRYLMKDSNTFHEKVVNFYLKSCVNYQE